MLYFIDFDVSGQKLGINNAKIKRLKLLDHFLNKEVQQKLNNIAQNLGPHYLIENIWQKWQSLLNDTKQAFGGDH